MCCDNLSKKRKERKKKKTCSDKLENACTWAKLNPRIYRASLEKSLK